MNPARIFISYRRDDAAGYARALYDALSRPFGAERVFIDVDDIAAGQAFDEVIRQAVGESKVLLVLVGKRWRGEREGQPPRIDDSDDPVRLEVASALARGMRVIPLLLDGATMPTEQQLPAELRPLARRNALEIGNTRFAADVERLVGALREALGEPAPAPAAPAGRRRVLLGAGLAAAALIGLATVVLLRPAPAPPAPAASRPAVNGAWQAEVEYDWPGARHVERFDFTGEAGELQGSASFLGVRRGALEGSVGADGLRFVTRSAELLDGRSLEQLHRYRGTLVGGEIRFVMQTEGGSSAHVPVAFIARRASSQPAR